MFLIGHHFFKGSSCNPHIIYEAGKCLSNAIIREWTTIICPHQLSSDGFENSQPYQLLCFLLQWVASSANEVHLIVVSFVTVQALFLKSLFLNSQVPAVGRLSILTSAAVLVKRAAGAQAESQATDSSATSPHARGVPSLVSPPFDNPGPASPIMTFFINELMTLLAPPTTSFQVIIHKLKILVSSKRPPDCRLVWRFCPHSWMK